MGVLLLKKVAHIVMVYSLLYLFVIYNERENGLFVGGGG